MTEALRAAWWVITNLATATGVVLAAVAAARAVVRLLGPREEGGTP